MTDLVEFLRARLAEDEQAARRAGETFRQIGETGVIVAIERDRAEECASANWTGIAEHIVRHDPARILRDVERDQRLLDLHAPGETEYVDGDVCMTCEVKGEGPYYPCQTLRLLTLPYADHPDYNESWQL
jgi:hypothetical protein